MKALFDASRLGDKYFKQRRFKEAAEVFLKAEALAQTNEDLAILNFNQAVCNACNLWNAEVAEIPDLRERTIPMTRMMFKYAEQFEICPRFRVMFENLMAKNLEVLRQAERGQGTPFEMELLELYPEIMEWHELRGDTSIAYVGFYRGLDKTTVVVVVFCDGRRMAFANAPESEIAEICTADSAIDYVYSSMISRYKFEYIARPKDDFEDLESNDENSEGVSLSETRRELTWTYCPSSSVVHCIGYDEHESTLVVFLNGGRDCYEYIGVPSSIHKAFINAASKGNYLSTRIVGKYPYNKADSHNYPVTPSSKTKETTSAIPRQRKEDLRNTSAEPSAHVEKPTGLQIVVAIVVIALVMKGCG